MQFQINSNDISSVVKSLTPLVNTTTASPAQACLLIEADGGIVKLTGLVTASHQIQVRLSALTSKAGQVFINAEVLSKLLSCIGKNTNTEIAYTDSFKVTTLAGSISEAVYHDQQAFNNLLSQEDTYTVIPIPYKSLLTLAQYADNESCLLIKGDTSSTYVVGSVSASSYILTKIDTSSEVNLFVKVLPIKKAASLLGDDNVEVGVGKRFLHLKSSTAYLQIELTSLYKDSGALDSVIVLSKELNTSLATLSVPDFNEVLKLQSYKSTSTDTVSLETTINNQVEIRRSSNDPSYLPCSGTVEKINLNFQSLVRAAQCSKMFPNNSSLDIIIKTVPVGDEFIKIAFLQHNEFQFMIHASV